jgi:serine protease Do
VKGSADGTHRSCVRCGRRLDARQRFCGACGLPTAAPTAANAPAALPSSRRRRRATVALASLVVLVALTGGTLALVLLTRGEATVDEAAEADAGPITWAMTPEAPATSETTTTTTPPPAPPPAPAPPPPPPTADSFADVFRRVHDGVVRIEAQHCGGGALGTGFLVAPDLVVTAAHVVGGSSALWLSTADHGAAGRIVGLDAGADLALVALDAPFGGHVFEVAAERPDVGAPVALIGYPLGEPLSLAVGAVSGLDRTSAWEGGELTGLVQTDVAANPGNSGGPLLDQEGRVVGVLVGGVVEAAGLSYAVGGEVVQAQVPRWQETPEPVPFESCGSDLPEIGPHPGSTVTSDVDHPDLAGLVVTFQTYVDGVNFGDDESAWSVLAGEARQRTSYEDFVAGNLTSTITAFRVRAVEGAGPSTNRVRVSMSSEQDPEHGPDGQPCSEWDLTYTTELVDGLWYITAVTPDGRPRPCAGG